MSYGRYKKGTSHVYFCSKCEGKSANGAWHNSASKIGKAHLKFDLTKKESAQNSG